MFQSRETKQAEGKGPTDELLEERELLEELLLWLSEELLDCELEEEELEFEDDELLTELELLELELLELELELLELETDGGTPPSMIAKFLKNV